MKYHILAGFIVFSMMTSISCMTIHANEGTSIQLMIYQQSSWKGCKKPRMAMMYRLKTSPQSSYYHDYKMKFSDRKMGITMYYSKPGLYSYYVSQNCAKRYKGMKYDRNKYHVRVMVRYVHGKLKAEPELPVNKRGFKEESMTFHNTYHKKSSQNPDQKPHDKKNIPVHNHHDNSAGNSYPEKNNMTTHKVKTGDTTDIKIYVISMIASFITLLFGIALGKRKKEKRR